MAGIIYPRMAVIGCGLIGSSVIRAAREASSEMAVMRARTELTAMPVDAKIIADSLDVWMKYWDSNIRNSQRDK